jgi:hypothetical protein
VALGRRSQVLVTVVDHAHRPTQPLGEQRGVNGDDRRVLFLAAESAAGLGLDDNRLLIGQAQRSLERGVDVVRALHRAVDRYPTVGPRDGDHRVVLDVQLLLVAHAVGAFDDQLGPRKAGVDISLLEAEVCELLGR